MFIPLVVSLFVAAELVAGDPELVAEGFTFTEGPAWNSATGWFFSDPAESIIYRSDKSVVRTQTGGANGLAFDSQGRLIFAEGGAGRLTRLEEDGSITVLADTYDGTRFNAPNDLILHSDGTIYFTDPLSLRKEDQLRDFAGVYSLSPDGQVTLLINDMRYPNGIGLSPDESTLYIADTAGREIRAYDLTNGAVSNGRRHAEVAIPDGFAVDETGRIWAAVSGGIQVIAAEGELLEKIPVRPAPTNCAFGGDDGSSLLVTARPKVFAFRTTTVGLGLGQP
jgi:gluconolactonase